ncbi:rhodanese-like domain-containing protein [bacterium]|nr:rhodanese-like domain-containing protein [bacterium]
MKKMRLVCLLFALPWLMAYNGCSDDKDKASVNESEVLLKYLESDGGNYINSAYCPAIVSAADVRTTQLAAPATQYIIDLRDTTTFKTLGHIEGAHNVALGELLNHMQAMNPAPDTYSRIVIACFSGQTAAYAASLLRLLKYENVYSLKWGMSSWDSVFATGKWLANTSNSRAASFVTTTTAKGAVTDLPVLSTGYSNAEDILEARVQDLLTTGFTPATITNSTLYTNLTGHYIVNYWSAAHYATGHIDGAIQYEPKADLKDSTYLRTLPLDKPVVVYCYSGQTSGFIAAYLRILGYDAKTLLWGVNGMNYDAMPGTKWTAAEIKQYPYVTGN